MFTAVSIILARFLGFYLTESLRLSFEYFSIILAGICFGPVAGAIVGGLSDFLGATIISGLGFYPPLLLSPVFAGLISGLLAKYVFHNRLDNWRKVMLVCIITELLSNLLWGTFALSMLYNSPFIALFAVRAPVKAVVMIIDAQLVFAVHKALQPLLKSKGGYVHENNGN